LPFRGGGQRQPVYPHSCLSLSSWSLDTFLSCLPVFSPLTLPVCLQSKSPRVSVNLHLCLQSAGVKRNYCCSLLCWAWWNYPKAVFIVPLSWMPVFNVLSALTPGVSLLRCSPTSDPTVCDLAEGHCRQVYYWCLSILNLGLVTAFSPFF
jgi:hypothetical protein